MAGTAVSPAPVTGMDMVCEGTKDTPSQVNAYRIAAVIDRFSSLQFNESKLDSVEFCNLCLSLARGIDYAVANQEIPTRALELPLLLKQISLHLLLVAIASLNHPHRLMVMDT